MVWEADRHRFRSHVLHIVGRNSGETSASLSFGGLTSKCRSGLVGTLLLILTTCYPPGTGPSGLDSLQPHPQTHAMSIDPPSWSKYAHWCITQRTCWAPTLCAAQPKADSLSCFQPHLHQPLMPHGVGAEEGVRGSTGGLPENVPCITVLGNAHAYTCTHTLS